MTKPIRILIADDHTVVREGIRTMLEPKPDMEFVAEAVDGLEAIEKCQLYQPDVVLIDLVMPRMNGQEAIQKILEQNPETKILVLTSFSEEATVIKALQAGAKGYLLKDSSPQDLVQAIYRVNDGEMWVYPQMMGKVLSKLIRPATEETSEDHITEREMEVLKLIATGMSNQEIALELHISEGTVRFHVTNLLSKLELANRTQLALYALRNGMATL